MSNSSWIQADQLGEIAAPHKAKGEKELGPWGAATYEVPVYYHGGSQMSWVFTAEPSPYSTMVTFYTVGVLVRSHHAPRFRVDGVWVANGEVPTLTGKGKRNLYQLLQEQIAVVADRQVSQFSMDLIDVTA